MGKLKVEFFRLIYPQVKFPWEVGLRIMMHQTFGIDLNSIQADFLLCFIFAAFDIFHETDKYKNTKS